MHFVALYHDYALNVGSYHGPVRYLSESKMCLLYLYATAKSEIYESLEGPLLKKENIFYLVITRKLTRNNEITNSL